MSIIDNKNYGLLLDVAIIRPILVVLVVFYHAFAIYSGGWDPIDGFPEIRAYWWLDKLSYAFMLELFVFISGYVFGYQVRIKGKNYLLGKKLFVNKFKRLIIPSIFFSLLYLLLFQNVNQPIGETLYDILSGVAHMWFLPMLFWCFVGVWLINKIQLPLILTLVLGVVLAILPLPTLPFRLFSTCYYFFFFYVGYILQLKNISIANLEQPKSAILSAIFFFIAFLLLTRLQQNVGEWMYENNQTVTKLFVFMIQRICQLIYSSAGIIMMLSIIRSCIKGKREKIPTYVFNFGGICMGIYLVQQFILKFLYNCTELPLLLGPIYLPWIGFMVTLGGGDTYYILIKQI